MKTMALTEDELSKEYTRKELFELACKNEALVFSNRESKDKYKIIATYSKLEFWWGDLLLPYRDEAGNCRRKDNFSVFCKGNTSSSKEEDSFGPRNIIIAQCIPN